MPGRAYGFTPRGASARGMRPGCRGPVVLGSSAPAGASASTCRPGRRQDSASARTAPPLRRGLVVQGIVTHGAAGFCAEMTKCDIGHKCVKWCFRGVRCRPPEPDARPGPAGKRPRAVRCAPASRNAAPPRPPGTGWSVRASPVGRGASGATAPDRRRAAAVRSRDAPRPGRRRGDRAAAGRVGPAGDARGAEGQELSSQTAWAMASVWLSSAVSSMFFAVSQDSW